MMQNYFYYSRNPYLQNIPRAFYSFQNQVARNQITSSFNFSSLINSAQKGINTINQLIPMYQQIKPIYNQAKNSFNSIKKYIKFPINNRNYSSPSKQTYQNDNFQNRSFTYENKGPGNPFFNN